MTHETNTRMGKISYINASPVFYGLDHGLLPDWLEMVPDVPSVLNRKLITGDIKLSPISAAFYAMHHKELLLLPDLSISCNGPVLSVILASNYPIEELDGKKVLFSAESASAASFLKMIFMEKNITPEYTVGDVTQVQSISPDTDAVLVIGDTALTYPWQDKFSFWIDLGQLWYEMKQLPFVFAVWAVRRSFARDHRKTVEKIHQLLLDSKTEGEKHMAQIINAGHKKLRIDTDTVKRYYSLLYCDMDDLKIKAMGLFFDSLYNQKIILEKADIQFYA